MAADTTPIVGRVAVIGAGWAGLSAAVCAVQRGLEVEVFEMAEQPGGRATSRESASGRLDNGQHILIGAYRETLALMRTVGVDPDHCLKRLPLSLTYPDGRGLALPQGPAVKAFVIGVLGSTHWRWRDRWKLLVRAAQWRMTGFRCLPTDTVERLCDGLPAVVMRDLVAPLCVAALNTHVSKASGRVFLRILKDALFAGPGASDLLLPTVPLSDVLPRPAHKWLTTQGATVHWRHRVQTLQRVGKGWIVDGSSRFDAVVLACTSGEAARLAQSHNPAWSHLTAELRHEPIVTVWLRDQTLHWAQPMLALRDGAGCPAQFAFDLGALGGPKGMFAFVISGAGPWLTEGVDAAAQAVVMQARAAFPGHFGHAEALLTSRAERRATMACTPLLRRPARFIASGLFAAGDHVDGPYPSTLEGAVLSGRLAVEAIRMP